MSILKINVEDLKKKFYVAARDGRTREMSSLLANWSTSRLIGEILNHQTSENGNIVSPLLIAVINGHEDIVRLLVNIPKTDIELGGNIWIEKQEVKNARPLWCAATFDYLSIVKLLAEYHAGIEGATETKSTPLRVACYRGNLKNVKYLVCRGADVNSSNSWGHACLMTAAYNGHVETVKYLLENRADIDRQDNSGRTAFHYAAEKGHIEVLKVLLVSGTAAKDVKDKLSFTPIMKAAENAQGDVVEFLISENIHSREEIIQVLELLGSRLSIPDKNDLQSALKYYRKAMDLRYNNSKDKIPKIDLDPTAAYDNRRECMTMDDLELIKENEFLLHMEALIIRERIVGPTHEEFVNKLEYMAATYADNNNHKVSISLLKHVTSANQIENKSMYKILELLVELMAEMFRNGTELVFSEVVDSLQLVAYELKKSKERKDSNDIMERNINTCLGCTGLLLQFEKKDQDARSLCTLVKQIVHLNPRLEDGSTLLHIAVSSTGKAGIITFPNASLCALLIQCGADVNCMDAKRNTPLHKICQLHHSYVDVHTQRTILRALISARVHADVTNTDGLTALECAQSSTSKILLKAWVPSLQCISTRVIITNRIPYKSVLPTGLEQLIELHC